jgi:hypothetical protein
MTTTTTSKQTETNTNTRIEISKLNKKIIGVIVIINGKTSVKIAASDFLNTR